MRTEVLLQHGWGFDERIWTKFASDLSENFPEVSIILGDRGYFGTQRAARFSNWSERRIIVAHSLGLHLLPAEVIRSAHAVMLLASFDKFHPSDPLANRRSKKVIAMMRDRLELYPEAVVQDFYGNCFAPEIEYVHIPINGELNIDRLEDDLELLGTGSFDLNRLADTADIVLVHGTGDRIVPAEKTSTIRLSLPQARAFFIEDAGHALPATQSDRCLFILEETILNKQSNKQTFAISETQPL